MASKAVRRSSFSSSSTGINGMTRCTLNNCPSSAGSFPFLPILLSPPHRHSGNTCTHDPHHNPSPNGNTSVSPSLSYRPTLTAPFAVEHKDPARHKMTKERRSTAALPPFIPALTPTRS